MGLEGRVQVGRVEKVSRGYVMETSKYLLIFFMAEKKKKKKKKEKERKKTPQTPSFLLFGGA